MYFDKQTIIIKNIENQATLMSKSIDVNLSPKINPVHVNQSDNQFQSESAMLMSPGQIQGKQQHHIQESKESIILDSQYSCLPQYLQGEQECSLCRKQFNLQKNVPMMICRNQHNCCFQCVKQLFGGKPECPFCRVPVSINDVKKNRILACIIQNQAKKRGREFQINSNLQKQLYNHISGGQFSLQYREESERIGQVRQLEQVPLQDRNQNAFVANVRRNTFCQNLNIIGNNHHYTLMFLIAMKCNSIFFFCDLMYTFWLQDQACIEEEYSHEFILISWLRLSLKVGIVMLFGTFLGVSVFVGVFGDRYENFSRALIYFVLIVQALKLITWVILYLSAKETIADEDQYECNGSVTKYIAALFTVYLFSACAMCLVLKYNTEQHREDD